MPLDHESKMRWMDSIRNQIQNNFLNSKQLEQLQTEIVQAFQAMMRELKNIDSKAAVQFYHWVMEHGPTFDSLFEGEPQLGLEQIDLLLKIFPRPIMDSLFQAALSLYLNRDHLNAPISFRLLTFLDPLNVQYRIWLGISLREKSQPQYALIPLTVASALSPSDPEIYLYIAECWMLIKSWDAMEGALKQALDHIESNPSFQSKCVELKTLIPLLAEDKISTPSLSVPSLQTSTTPSSSLTKESWDAINRKIAEAIDKLSIPATNAPRNLGIFESQPLPNSLMSPFEILAATLFLGVLDIGIQISSANKMINEVPQNPLIQLAYKFSLILDQNDAPIPEELIKYLYLCDNRKDIVINHAMKNIAYGTEELAYDEARESAEIRVSYFLKEDIINKSILDFGCNEGSILFACKDEGAKAITGIDLFARCIEKAKSKVASKNIQNAHFYVADIENSAFLTTLPQADTVFLLAVLDTSHFVNKTAVIAKVSKFAKQALYYEGHVFSSSHVPRMYEFLIATDFTRFEFLGTHEHRPLIRFGRELIDASKIPPNAVTSNSNDADLLNAQEIYWFTNSQKNPPFSKKCRLIQFVKP